MNYTLTQAIDRAKDLSGLLKGARAHEADCAADHSAKLRIAEIAAEAHKKAASACIELEQEREALADHIAALVRKVGDPIEMAPTDAAEAVSNFGSVFGEPNTAEDLADRLMARSEERMNGAFDAATHP